MESKGSVPFSIFNNLREKYLELETAYRELEAKYKRNVIDADTDGDWTDEDDEREKLLPSWRNIKPFLPVIQQIDRRYNGFLASMVDGFKKEIDLEEESQCRVQNPNFISEDELLEEFKLKFNLYERKEAPGINASIQVKPKMYDEVTQIFNPKKSKIETQTPAVYRPTHVNASTQLNLPPKTNFDRITPRPSTSASIDPPPITVTNPNLHFSCQTSQQLSNISRNVPLRPDRKRIPSLFEVRVPPSRNQ